ncbi:E3 ubiquitin-protein ligase Topors-like [Hoplias malabaricus]
MMAPTKMKLRVRKKDGGAKSSSSSRRRLMAETSPDSKCPICLDRFNNAASLDRCLHRFCFRCIHEWSKNKAECPLCKQPFRSIFHSVRAENDFKEFVLATDSTPVASAAAPPAGHTHAVTRPARPRRARGQRGTERRSYRRQTPGPPASSPPDVRMEDLVEGTEETVEERVEEEGVERMMRRLTARRRWRVEELSLRRLRDQDVVAFRRALYRAGVRVRSGVGEGRNDVSAAYLRRNPASLRRLLPWLQRELTVLYGSHGSLVSIVQHIILSRITHSDMDAAAVREELRPFLLARTDHFLHELLSFARSQLSIEAYDQQAVYECPAPSYEEDSSSSSIIAISEDEDSEHIDITEDHTQGRVPPVTMAMAAESSLSHSGWDDETPGPSYSTVFPSPSQSQAEGAEPVASTVPAEGAGHASGSAEAHEDEEEECMIVGYVKPMAERTPELVQLSSDTSEEEQEEAAKETSLPKETVQKVEASSSHNQAPDSLDSYLRPLSPSSCLYPNASSSTHSRADKISQEKEDFGRLPSGETGGERDLARKSSSQMHGFSDCSPSGSDNSVLSRNSGRSRFQKHSGCSHQERNGHRESQKLSQSSSVFIASDSFDSSRSPSCEQPQSRNGPRLQNSDEERERTHSISARERSSQSSVYCDSPGRVNERKKAKKKRLRREKLRDRSRSPLRDHSASRSRHAWQSRHENRLHTSSHSSSRGSSSSEDTPCPEKPAGKRKYKTRHLERAAQRQSSRKSGREKQRKTAAQHSSPTKGHRKRERQERSPSVEIIFERRASEVDSDSHRWRRKRHKKRSRRQARPHNSPTIITILSDSDTNDYQDHITGVTNRTCSSQEGVAEASGPQQLDTKLSNITNDSQYQISEVKKSMADDQQSKARITDSKIHLKSHVNKATTSTNEGQDHVTDVSIKTTEDQQLVAKVTSSTSRDQQSVTKDNDSISKDQHNITTICNNAPEHHRSVTKVTYMTADNQQLVAKIANVTSDDQHHVTKDTNDCGQPVLEDTCRDIVAELEDRLAEGHKPTTKAPLGDVNNLFASTTLPVPSLEPYSPVTTDCVLNLENCVVDVVDRESFQKTHSEPSGRSELSRSTITPPSDTRLLESILQELGDILPEVEQGAEPRQEGFPTDSGIDQLEAGIVPHRDQSDAGRERTGNAETSG